MNEKLVVIAQYDNAELAHVDHDLLEEAGIPAYIENETISVAGLYPVISHCEVRLTVSQSDAEKARQFLKEIQESGPIDEETDVSDPDGEDNKR